MVTLEDVNNRMNVAAARRATGPEGVAGFPGLVVPASTGRWAALGTALRWLAMGLVVLECAPGCKLVELKMPGEPLPKADFALRGQTREFAKILAGTVEQVADAIARETNDPAIRAHCLEWKIGAVNSIRTATLRSSPKLALVDAWAFCRQMDDFLDHGPGANLFGPYQSMALTNSQALEHRLAQTARTLLSGSDFAELDLFLDGYVTNYPLRTIAFNREPVVPRWEDYVGKPFHNPPAGTGSEALSDVAERLQMLGEQIPEEVRWRLMLESDALEAQWARTGVTFDKLDKALGQVGEAAAASPAALTNAVLDLQAAFLPAFDKFQSEWTNTTRIMQEERKALTESLSVERAAVLKDIDQQRAATLKETQVILSDLTDRSLTHVRGIIRDVLFYVVLLAGIVLGLPFLSGFLLGRAWTRLRKPKGS